MYPALSIIQYLAPSPADLELIYVGSSRGMESSIVPCTDIRCFFLPMAPPSSLRGVALLALAALRSIAICLRRRPQVAFATGGYVSTPMTWAAWLLRVPVVLFLPDVVPGRAVVRLAPLARKIAVSTPAALAYLPPEKTVVTGYPVREVFRHATRSDARRRLQLPSEATVLCVFGGSQGSRSINRAVAAQLNVLLQRHYIIHVCGERSLNEAKSAAAALPADLSDRYRLFAYLHDEEMADALAACDLALCRSGASTLGELPATGTPSILVPLPEAAVHQRENADYLERAGAAIIVDDSHLASRLADVVESILGNDEKRDHMAAAAASLDTQDAARALARVAMQFFDHALGSGG